MLEKAKRECAAVAQMIPTKIRHTRTVLHKNTIPAQKPHRNPAFLCKADSPMPLTYYQELATSFP